MARYDEDLFDNPFYKAMASKQVWLNNAAKNNWIVCIPRKIVSQQLTANVNNFENHILCPLNASSGIYRTINNKIVKIIGDLIRTEKGFKEDRTVQILFEETHYDDEERSCRVVCLEKALEGGSSLADGELSQTLRSSSECEQFLWNSSSNKRCKELIDNLLKKSATVLDSKADKSLRWLMDNIGIVFTSSVQTVMKDVSSNLRKQANEDSVIMANMKLALETYILDFLYDKIFKIICCTMEIDDVKFNKLTRNLGNQSLSKLGLHSSTLTSMGEALLQMNLINKCRTPLEKMYCLHKTLMAIIAMKGRDRALTTDDLLPILIALMLKAEIPNWLATLFYINNFHFSNAMAVANEFAFCLTSIEAAVEHIRGGTIGADSLPSEISKDKPQTLRRYNSDSKRTFATDELLFETVRSGDVQKVKALMEGPTSWNVVVDKMCHPLCQCSACEELQKNYDTDPLAATVHSRNDCGNTVLHVAAENGHEEIVNLLLDYGAEIDGTNNSGYTPLHLACQRGYPKTVLLLCRRGADVNAADNDDYTPLHSCAVTGHEETAKVLLFNEFNGKRANVNSENISGNTPLHVAAKWGYANLVELFVENGAAIEARNKNMETALDCSNLSHISQIISLAKFAQSRSKAIDMFTESDIKNVLCESSDQDHFSKTIRRLFVAILDGDVEMVCFLFGWNSETLQNKDTKADKRCHPLCQCSNCGQLNKSASNQSILTVDSTDDRGYTPLHMAAMHGRAEIASILLSVGCANCNAKTKIELLTPLHIACRYNQLGVISILIEHHARINAKSIQGNTPLHYSCIHGHVDATLLLLSHHAYPNVRNHQGDTPLHVISRWNIPQLANLLLEYGAITTIKNNMHLTPSQCAQNDEIVRILSNATCLEMHKPVSFNSSTSSN